jgi:hypothetical protein
MPFVAPLQGFVSTAGSIVTGQLLLAGDMTDGDDELLLAGDMTDGDDKLTIQETI